MRAAPTRAELLAPVVRWRPERKARLLAGIQNGLISMADARVAPGLSAQELEAWWKAWQRDGMRALRTTVKERQAS
jgi:transposase-like protein